MLFSLQNSFLKLSFSDLGAELTSVISVKTGKEYLWNADPAYWPRHAPVLFPVVGALKDSKYTYNGKEYALAKHGYARDTVFKCIKSDDTSISFEMASDAAMLQAYPFQNRLRISYRLEDNKIYVDYDVCNDSDEDMYFTIGAHEGYACPRNADEKFEDYYIEFETPGNYTTSLTVGDGLLTGETVEILKDGNIIGLKYDLFDKDALIFPDVCSSIARLKSKKSKEYIEVDYTGMPHLGIWTKKSAPFVCIEPWCGIPDSVSSSGNITEKESVIHLPKNNTYHVSHSIKICE